MADLLIQWEDLYRQGQDTPADVLCKDCPELAATLSRQIAALKRVAWLDKKLEDDGDDPANDPPDDTRPPRLLAGRYRLDELVATGGFAEVWRAFDQELQRIIAVKIPKRTVIGAADSFLAEARRVARLKHPSILPVYDVGLEDNECFFVSEYVDGGSLADRLLKGKLSPEQACRWIGSIADALDHAHRSGVIHRDIKPGNILIDAHDRALLADFGIAQSSMKTGSFAPSLGTLRYMAPEQLDGQAAVPQSDIYSLAVVLHEALTGKPPYSSGEPNTLRREIGSGAQISRDVPNRLAPVLRQALHKDPGQRYGSAAEFAAAVRKVARPSSWRVSVAFATAAALLLSALAWAGLAIRQQAPSPPPKTQEERDFYSRNTNAIFLSDLPERDVLVNFSFGTNGQRGYFNRLIIVNDAFASKGISTHCMTGQPVGVTYDVPPNARRFMTVVAIADDVGSTQPTPSDKCWSPITFRVLDHDGAELWKTPRPVTKVGEMFACDISVTDAKAIRLEASCAGQPEYCCAVWLNPCFVSDDTEVPDALRQWWRQDREKPSPELNGLRTEMPYPLPPFNRRVWRSQPGRWRVFRFDDETGWWCEYGSDGRLNFRFRQARVTDDGIDLEDPARRKWLTLTDNAVKIRSSPAYPFEAVMANGGWDDPSASPYPPEFDKLITIMALRASLENYLRQLSQFTGLEISINNDALIWQGITRNQSFGLDVKDTPAHEVLLAILNKADPDDRLRAVLKARADGSTAIEITTKQALEKQT